MPAFQPSVTDGRAGSTGDDVNPGRRLGASMVLAGSVLTLGLSSVVASWIGDRFNVALFLHAAIFLVLAIVGPVVSGVRPRGWLAWTVGTTMVVCAAGMLWPSLNTQFHSIAVYGHVVVGVLTVGLLIRLAINQLSVRHSFRINQTLSGGLVLLLLLYFANETRRMTWRPPRYDSAASYRFLTATAAEQSGEPNFPSALRLQRAVKGRPDNDCARCHASTGATPDLAARHAVGAGSVAYRKTLAEFEARRGKENGVWCQGCHAPAALTASGSSGQARREGFTCGTCHQTANVHALFGSAALEVRGDDQIAPHLAIPLRRKQHSQLMLRPDLHRSSEFCGGCHRKNWSLPQNSYHWMPGPDELGQWQNSSFAPGALFAVGSRSGQKACVDCHNPHGPHRQSAGSAIDLDLFVSQVKSRREVALVEHSQMPAPGEVMQLDVIVRNAGIGHDFPTGMPDLDDNWLEITALNRSHEPVLTSGRVPEGSHIYRLLPLDLAGKPVIHGDLDRMVATAEWRRIPPGSADLARYTFKVPAAGIASFQVRLLRKRRREFSRWAGESEAAVPVELANTVAKFAEKPWSARRDTAVAARWRYRGMALTSVRAYPEALQALHRALEMDPDNPETLLCLGNVYLDEGDLLAARDEFRKSQSRAPERARAWEGAVLRRMGQADRAITLLQPLTREHPRDLRLRFELGSALLAALRNEEAAREFEAMLDVDPIDVSAHYNLMLCFQRLNRLTDARREETIYRLLRPEAQKGPRSAVSLEATPLHIHELLPNP